MTMDKEPEQNEGKTDSTPGTGDRFDPMDEIERHIVWADRSEDSEPKTELFDPTRTAPAERFETDTVGTHLVRPRPVIDAALVDGVPDVGDGETTSDRDIDIEFKDE